MSHLKNILEYQFFSIGEFTLSVYDLLSIILVFLFAWLIVMLIRLLVHRSRTRKKWGDETKENTIVITAGYFIYTAAVIISLSRLGIDVSIFVAGSAALFVGIGLGLQSIFNDIISGIFLLFDSSVKVGDIVEVDGLVARVREMNIRTSKITTRDEVTMIVPNSHFVSNKVINWSHGNQNTRFRILVSTAYGTDTQKVKEVLLDCADVHEEVLKKPEPVVRMIDFGDSGLEFELLFWIGNPWEIEFTRSDLRFAIDLAFRKHGIIIPYPQRDVHVSKLSDPSELIKT